MALARVSFSSPYAANHLVPPFLLSLPVAAGRSLRGYAAGLGLAAVPPGTRLSLGA